MYAIAAGATRVGALALARPSEAKIAYTRANTRISGLVRLDLSNDGITGLVLCLSFPLYSHLFRICKLSHC